MRVGSTHRPTLTVPRSAGRRHGWRPPYSLPNAGEVVSISTNYAGDVWPAGIGSISNWNYSLFGSYSSGALIEDYSIGGAYVIAGSGGHNHPPNVGAAIFDFADATWKRKDNANSVAYQSTDYPASEIDATFGEIIADSPAGLPAPAHVYAMVGQQRVSQSGGSKGSVIILKGQSAAVDSTRGSNYTHAMDLDTGRWTRLSTNGLTHTSRDYRSSGYDAQTNRFYLLPYDIGDGLNLEYFDTSDWTWKTTSMGSPAQIGSSFSTFIDNARRLIVVHTDVETLRALDLDNLSNGATTLTLSGSLPNNQEHFQWHFFPPDGCFYMFAGRTTTATINKLRPPNLGGNPLSDTWTVSTVTLGTALTQQPQTFLDAGAVGNNRFFFVPSINCFCWIAGDEGTSTTPVVILKPPA